VSPIKDVTKELPKQPPLIEKERIEENVVEQALPKTVNKEEILPESPIEISINSTPEVHQSPIIEKDDTSQRIQSASPPEDPLQEERCPSEASSVDSHPEIETQKPLTNDEEKMLAATTEIMRQLNALDVDTVRVISAPKARIDSDDDLEEDGKI
jgi:hypothetical protein